MSVTGSNPAEGFRTERPVLAEALWALGALTVVVVVAATGLTPTIPFAIVWVTLGALVAARKWQQSRVTIVITGLAAGMIGVLALTDHFDADEIVELICFIVLVSLVAGLVARHNASTSTASTAAADATVQAEAVRRELQVIVPDDAKIDGFKNLLCWVGDKGPVKSTAKEVFDLAEARASGFRLV